MAGFRIGLVMAVALAGIASAAQTPTGGLAGRVTDSKGNGLVGVVVSASGPCLPGTPAGVTDAEGRYRLAHLPPCESVDVVFEAQGLSRVVRHDVPVRSDALTEVNAVLAEGGDEISVSAPRMNAGRAGSPVVFPEPQIRDIPVLGEFRDRSFQSLLYWTPGATHSRLAGNPAMAGATGIENIYVMDGVVTNDPVTGTFGTNLNVGFLASLELEPVATEAGEGASTGGLFNVVTRSAGDEFSGDVFAWGTADALTAKEHSNDFEVNRSFSWRAYDAGFTVGGPIVKGRAWVFAGYNPASRTQHQEGFDVVRNAGTGAQRGLPYDEDDVTETSTYLAKFLWRPTPRHSLSLGVFGDASRAALHEGPRPTLFPAASRSRRVAGSTNVVLAWNAAATPSFFTEALVAATHRREDLSPWRGETYGIPLVVSQDWDQDLALTPGFGRYRREDRDTRQASVKASWLLEGFGGRHELSASAQGIASSWDRISDYTGGRSVKVRNQNGPDLTDPADYRNRYVTTLQGTRLEGRGRYVALALQDAWSPTGRLTLTGGLRAEWTSIWSPRGNGLSLATVSPRLGVTWDLSGGGRTKVFAAWGRYAERVPLYLSLALDGTQGSSRTSFLDGVRVGRSTYTQRAARVVPGVRNQSQTDAVLGVQVMLRPDTTLTLRAVTRDLDRLLETVGYVDPATGSIDLLVMNPGRQWSPLLETWRGVIPDFAPFPRPVRRYKALEIQIEKRYSDRWFFQANATLSRLEGNTAAGYDRNIPELAPNATREWDIPSARWAENRFGPLSTDRTLQVKAVGAYRWEGGLVLGGTLRFDTGRPISRLYDWPEGEPGYGKLFAAPRGSSGRLPSALTLGLHAEMSWALGEGRLTIFGDVLNVLNDQPAFRVEETFLRPRDGWGDPAVRDASWGLTRSRTDPRAAAFGVRWTF